jgi:DNA polymerase-4
VVAAASYEARAFGVHSAMPSAQARKLCPQAVFVRGDARKYARESRRIFEIFRRFTPLVEGISLDEAFLDLTGTERLLGAAPEVARALRAAVRAETGLAVSVGLAPVKLVAKIASDLAKPDGLLCVAPDRLREFLAPLPAGRLWGVGPVAQQRLAARGLHTIDDLARAPDAILRELLGNFGPQAARLARGEDTREVEPYREPKSYGEENTFERDVSDLQLLERAIRSHAEAVARRLRRDGIRARGVTLKLKLARALGGGRYPLLTRARTLLRSTDDGAELARAARELLRAAGLGEPVRLIGVAATRLEAAAAEQLELFGAAQPARRAALNRALDGIRERFGEGMLERAGAAEIDRAGLSPQITRGFE